MGKCWFRGFEVDVEVVICDTLLSEQMPVFILHALSIDIDFTAC
jgi:hypothetical protein